MATVFDHASKCISSKQQTSIAREGKGAHLVQAESQGRQQAQEADARHPQVSQAILHQQVVTLEGGLEGDGLAKGGPQSTPAALQPRQQRLDAAAAES